MNGTVEFTQEQIGIRILNFTVKHFNHKVELVDELVFDTSEEMPSYKRVETNFLMRGDVDMSEQKRGKAPF
jgi:hypothetical protein